VLLRLAYLGVTNTFAVLRLRPISNRDKGIEILALRHQTTVLERQLGKDRPRYEPSDRALLAVLLHRLPRNVLSRLLLLVRWTRSCAGTATCSPPATRPLPSRGARAGRALSTSVRALVLRLAKDNPSWGYRRLHGELLALGLKVAASTVWEILQEAGDRPGARARPCSTRADFPRCPADALLACDFMEMVTLTGGGCTCWRSSSMPAAGSGSWAPPRTRSPHGWRKRRGTSPWNSKTSVAGCGVAVGTAVASGPRTDPSVRNYRTGLLPQVLAARRTFGYGCNTRTRGSHRVAYLPIRSQLTRPR
jgi:hypothetical protein